MTRKAGAVACTGSPLCTAPPARLSFPATRVTTTRPRRPRRRRTRVATRSEGRAGVARVRTPVVDTPTSAPLGFGLGHPLVAKAPAIDFGSPIIVGDDERDNGAATCRYPEDGWAAAHVSDSADEPVRLG